MIVTPSLYGPILEWGVSVVIIALDIDSQRAIGTQRYALAMITTLMPHLRIGPYKEGVTIDQIQMPSTQLDALSLMSSW